MPVTPTYPGVYIEEIPSGVRTITGVATSITAFLGKAPRGPTDEPVTITSFADYERVFGGLHRDSTLSYAVRDFFLNGGSQAIIVRLYKSVAGKAARATYELPTNPPKLTLEAASAGAWGMQVRVRVEAKSSGDPNVQAVARRLGVQPADLFDLTVRDGGAGAIETFLNLTTKESARRVDRVLKAESRLVRVKSGVPSDTGPTAHSGALTDNDVWTDNTKSTPAKTDPADEAVDSDPLDSDTYRGSSTAKTGLYQLEKVDLFNLLCILPDARGGDVPDDVYQEALSYCVKRRAVLLVDPRNDWTTVSAAQAGVSGMNLTGDASRNAAIFFPRIKQADPLLDGQIDTFVPCGAIAGVMARTDAQRGVWKAPAGIDAALNGVAGLQLEMTDAENGLLNPLGINCLRAFPVYGRVVWGARTMRGADVVADEYKYIPVRRLALFIEESLYRGTQWVVFEPNDEPLWAQIRLNIGAFMNNLFRQGAFQGRTPREAYFVKCDKETTTQNDINLGIVNILVGFAPLKPAEFVIIKLQQMAGQIQV
ncbi:MAG: phage tail sheath subtilisin-like domain-containing protein [Oscillochloridaceae bacterium]|nr:phage tail sheath subtilisin-like domain-containing protein [Chloroflexaceae bacterium]MDW8391683.1 phage tail sheath subtilisin-like domain-containing protein [Oscillochloridaceae bacterium]